MSIYVIEIRDYLRVFLSTILISLSIQSLQEIFYHSYIYFQIGLKILRYNHDNRIS